MQTGEHVTTDAKINVLDTDSSDTEFVLAINLYETGLKISPCVPTEWCLRHEFAIGKYLYLCIDTAIDISVSNLGGMPETTNKKQVTTCKFACTDMRDMTSYHIIVTELTDMNGIVTNMDGMVIDMNDTNINNSNNV